MSEEPDRHMKFPDSTDLLPILAGFQIGPRHSETYKYHVNPVLRQTSLYIRAVFAVHSMEAL